MDDAPPPRDPDPGVTPLDRLLRPPDPGERWRALLRRVGADRRLLVGTLCAVAAVGIAVAGVVVWRSGAAAPSATVTLPRARPGARADTSDATDAGGSTSASGAAGSGGSASDVTSTTAAAVVVDVAGAVVRPGLVSIAAGGRVADAVAAAGGLRPDADADRLNLASPVGDGTRVYVAAVGQGSIPIPIGPNGGGGGPGGSAPGSTSIPAPVPLNTATADDLDALPGVGPSTAQAIISYRTAHGPFASVDDLDQVRGIGPAKLSQLRDLVTTG